ncbi:CDP-glycerol glycerophosphotransferase family protein [Prevotella sp. E2-28]|uniref:CDP-glycerol glycerophosphotransferase family protein n=1 Tax=Prevotella sp. E2-28 TaxID=2913620 RepID=UPI001EDB8917|nr:CDP-glycerol glycerophosphotransferase family protein [Prevotella sp. E2-28]UKK53544.1 CDP-glycerol glycerophosphotransferase family protein [Prevotella sp. E2-28]
MKILLFCENKYAVDIVRPLQDEADRQGGHEVLWYVHKKKIPEFPLRNEVRWTNSIQEAYDFHPDAVFAPGNIVPYYLSGVKCSIFHGYAAEKRDQFRIRNYYDMYMTQGPYFTQEFLKLQETYKDFEVVETGWTRQDWIARHRHDFEEERKALLWNNGCDKMVLYAPTFSPKLSSLPKIKDDLIRLLTKKDILLLIKLHPLTQKAWVNEYKQLAENYSNVIFEDDFAVTKYMLMADVMISDTSSTIYEMLLLDKPVITLDTVSQDPYWKNINDASQLISAYDEVFNNKELTEKRKWIIQNYDPYTDGNCAQRMLEGVQQYIKRHGVPEKRKLNLWRKYVSIKTFGRVK